MPDNTPKMSSPIMGDEIIDKICAGLQDLHENKCHAPALKEAASKLQDFIFKYCKKNVKELATSYLKPRISFLSKNKGIGQDAAELIACFYMAALELRAKPSANSIQEKAQIEELAVQAIQTSIAAALAKYKTASLFAGMFVGLKPYQEKEGMQVLNKISGILVEKHFIPAGFNFGKREDRELLRDQLSLLFQQANSLLKIVDLFDEIILKSTDKEIGQFAPQIRQGWSKIKDDIIKAGYTAKEDALEKLSDSQYNNQHHNQDNLDVRSYIISTLSAIADNCDIEEARDILVNLEFDAENFDLFAKLSEQGFSKEDELIMKLVIKAIPLSKNHKGLVLENLQNFFYTNLIFQYSLETKNDKITSFYSVIDFMGKIMDIKDLLLKEQIFTIFARVLHEDLHGKHYIDCKISKEDALKLSNLQYEKHFSKEHVALFNQAINNILPQPKLLQTYDSEESTSTASTSTASTNSNPTNRKFW